GGRRPRLGSGPCGDPLDRRGPHQPGAPRDAVRATRARRPAAVLGRAVELPAGRGQAGRPGAARRADRPAGRGPPPDQLPARRRRNGQRDSGPGAVSGLSRPHAEETSTMSEPDFTVEIYQNEYLPEGGRDVNAVITVATAGTASAGTAPAGPAPGASSAEIIIVDSSGSMNAPPSKIAEARAATAAAVDVIRDGVAFAVIAGT